MAANTQQDAKEQQNKADIVINWVKKHPVLAALVMSGLGTSLGFVADAVVRNVKSWRSNETTDPDRTIKS